MGISEVPLLLSVVRQHGARRDEHWMDVLIGSGMLDEVQIWSLASGSKRSWEMLVFRTRNYALLAIEMLCCNICLYAVRCMQQY
jgi:hypothetical protein